MLSLAEALERAAAELAHDTELLGTRIVAGPGLETPNFWVFYPNSERAFETGESADSLSYRIPPVVVDRRSGSLTRPIGPGSPVRAADLGPDEWFILQPIEPRQHESADGLLLGEEVVARLLGLERFRLRRGGHGSDGDALEAILVADRPSSIESGLREAGLDPAPHGWSHRGGERVTGYVALESALVVLRLAGCAEGESPWSVSASDVALAEHLEGALSDAGWIRFWI